MADTTTTTTTTTSTELVAPETAKQAIASEPEVTASDTSSPASEATPVRTMVETATMTDAAEQKESESSAPVAPEVDVPVVKVPEGEGATAKEAVEAEEEPDTLSPLMTDNHTFLQHHEIMREDPNLEEVATEPGSSSPQQQQQQQHFHRHHHHHGHGVEEVHDYGIYDDDEQEDDEDEDDDDEDIDDEDEMFMRDQDEPEPNMKHSDTKESISSIDSDVSLSYDRRSASELQQLQQQHRQHSEDAGAGSSDDAAKDSGCEIAKKSSGEGEGLEAGEIHEDGEEGTFEIPDDEMCERIIEQVEFYFSNENILKDAFLLKHVRRNKEGFVSLKLVSSFKRVRQLTKDWRVVGYAIKRKSVRIEVNDLGTKIRRLEALPEHDETTPSRTVVATGLPYDKYTVEKVSELFSKCGEISLIRVLRPGGPIPADVRQFINKHPELQESECALVEFTESSSARRAQALADFVVLELVAPKKKTGKKATNVTKFVESYKVAAGHEIERSRGGEGFDRFRMRRGSGFYPKADMMVGALYQQQQQVMSPHHHHHHHHQMLPMMSPPMQAPMPADPHQLQQQSPPMPYMVPHSPQPRKYSFGNETYEYFQPQQQQRRASAYSLGSDASRKFSSCSEGYSSCGEMSRRTSACSSVPAEGISRRTSACSEVPSSRRSSNCSDFCSCNARRISQCSTDLMYRRMSQCSADHPGTPVHSVPRKYSVGSNYDRKYANSPELLQQQQQQLQQGHLLQRRISMDSTGAYDGRKFSSGSITGYHTDGSPNISPRKYSSNGFDPLRKLSSGSDQYYNGRKISTDSGYDRRISIGSECSGPRSRAGSVLCSHGNTALPTPANEAVVRTPIGPDGSKGFGTRTRRIGQIVPPA
ncbi:uncharacterized protein LOC128726036 [Anopheles nili]|uniref:uncharacterized protein LOC128726036 n=1 Tax=Anopheles nili TaxID=185578 RepID=UPI00237C22ED|nr:uncharacterized protein LOC128726036 [Anopheles nili]